MRAASITPRTSSRLRSPASRSSALGLRFTDIELDAFLAHGLDDQVDVGMRLIGVKQERLPMLQRELIASKVAGRFEDAS